MVGKEFAITKVADEQQIVLGWANVSMTEDGIPIEDYQHDMIEPEELERAAYEYVLKFRDTGEGHNPKLRKKGKLVESVVFTKEKLEVMGIPEGTIPLGWWIGFKIEDKSTWDKVKKGEYTMFSIEGTGERESIEKASHNPKAMTFDEVFKFNPNHDELGRFASGPGGASGAKTTSSKMSRKQINELPDKVFSHEDFKEAAKLVSDILEEDDYGYFGLRAQEKDTETVGREMKHKSLDMTEEGSNKRLNGVSSVGVTWDGDIHRKAGNYSGRVIYLLGANRNSDELENDPGEKVLQSPTVLAKIVFHDGKMTIADRIVQKHIKAKNFDQIYSKDIEKFNPYHDELGRFASSPSSGSASDKKVLTGEMSLSVKRTQSFASGRYDYYYSDMLDIKVGEISIGSANVIYDDKDKAYLERIDIDEEYRNQGYGTKAINQIVDTYGSIYVAPDNERARNLYDRMGYEANSHATEMYDQGYGVFEIS